jgi:hypothetical protein
MHSENTATSASISNQNLIDPILSSLGSIVAWLFGAVVSKIPHCGANVTNKIICHIFHKVYLKCSRRRKREDSSQRKTEAKGRSELPFENSSKMPFRFKTPFGLQTVSTQFENGVLSKRELKRRFDPRNGVLRPPPDALLKT